MNQTFLNIIESKVKKITLDKFKINLKKITIDKVKNISKGDFYTNAGMIIASTTKQKILDVCNVLRTELLKLGFFDKIEIENAFINFFINNTIKLKWLKLASNLQSEYGQFSPKKSFYNIEFVSANPTGYLHIGHARNAALGMTLSNIWKKNGIIVDNEYYVNDAGNQINKLALSVFLRYLQIYDLSVPFDGELYFGDEIKIIANNISAEFKKKFTRYKYNDEKILNDDVFEFFKNYSKLKMLDIIKKDLKNFRIKFKRYFSESSIYEKKLIDKTIKKLGKNVYLHENALWLKTTKYGDDKDRVIIKSDKNPTYFMPDIAYHNIKLNRGYDKLFNVFGADHNAYVTSMKAAIGCLGHKVDKLNFIVMQMVRLTKNGQEFKMSKRSGTSLTLRDLISCIGVDNARWSLITQASNSHLEIDVDKYSSGNQDTNLNYVFFTLNRINKIIKKSKYEKKLTNVNVDLLNLSLENELIDLIIYYPHTIYNIGKSYDIQKLPAFILQLSSIFNKYYESNKILNDDNLELTKQRIFLLNAIKATLLSSLGIMDIKYTNKVINFKK